MTDDRDPRPQAALPDAPETAAPTSRLADRRNVLRGAAVLAAALPVSASAERLIQPTDHQAGARYRDSEHVQRFYELNRR